MGIGWVVSIGFYEIGLWPLGAILRVGVWGFALFGLYWIIKHLLRSPTDREDEITWPVWMLNREVDPVPRSAVLGDELESLTLECVAYVGLKRIKRGLLDVLIDWSEVIKQFS